MKANADAAKKVLALMTLAHPMLLNDSAQGVFSDSLITHLLALSESIRRFTQSEDASNWEQRIFESIDPNV